MNKQIQAIFVNRKHQGKTYISVNFGSRYSAGNIVFDRVTRTYTYENLTEEQIAEARALAYNSVAKRWENWMRTEAKPVTRELIEDTREDLAEVERFNRRPQVPPAEPEIFG